jgi:hypothetical protein
MRHERGRERNASVNTARGWATALLLAWVACGLALASPSNALAAPPPLSAEKASPNVASTYGSGDFGQWGVDRWGLPVYHYTDDQATDPNARQPELAGASQAQHQVGNDNIKGMAFNDGYTQLWSQQLVAQWANMYSPEHEHYAGGYGYLNVGGKVGSTFYLDHQTDESFLRDFGVGYSRKSISFHGLAVSEDTVAPFGSDPILLDNVTITNTASARVSASWFEYWDVNPYEMLGGEALSRGLLSPTWDPASRTLAVSQFGNDPRDTQPLSIFASALNGPAPTYDTSVSNFFGSGTRAVPAEVAADRLSETTAAPNVEGQTGNTLFVFRTPVSLAPGRSVTLHYIYGMAHPSQISELVASYAAQPNAENHSELAWQGYVPKANFGSSYTWVARELEWDAYLLRSAAVYEERCGEHTITQGGYYQYLDGLNLGERSWDHYELPMVYSDPELAREILRYTVHFQPPGAPQNAQLPYGSGPFCERVDLGTSNDLDFWLLNAAAEYGLATRDLSFFRSEVPYYGGAPSASVWEHLKWAFEHAESMHGPNGEYVMGTTGDWSDFSTEFMQMTESTLVTAQMAYAYPRLAQVARLMGESSFAEVLDAAGAKDLQLLRGQWTGEGWYSRGYSGTTQVGQGVIFEEPQPWAVLAGAPTPAQDEILQSNIHRYLDGYGAPGGPSRIGSALVPGYGDPGVTEHGPLPFLAEVPGVPSIYQEDPPENTLSGADEWPGGTWFDPNGWLTWAYASLDGTLPGAVEDAWSEYIRNTLANHATVWPEHWAGTISVDDACYGYYSAKPENCGIGLSTAFDGTITEQPTWMVMDAIHLAGVTPNQAGYEITPHLPMSTFELRFPQIGLAQQEGLIRGYLTTSGGSLTMRVAPPPGVSAAQAVAYAGTKQVPTSVVGGLVQFTLKTSAGKVADWAVSGP